MNLTRTTFKEKLIMEFDSKVTTKVIYALQNCELEDKPIFQDIYDNELIKSWIKYEIRTGNNSYPELQQEMEQQWKVAEGNFELTRTHF